MLALLPAAPVDMNSPGTYLHWSVFQVSVANLVIVCVMVVLFGLALLLPFPREAGEPLGDGGAATGARGDGGAGTVTSRAGPDGITVLPAPTTWTGVLRQRLLRALPPEKLLPERQPAYVASWVYVFGVASLAALVVAVGSGFAIAIGGTDWWHTTAVGHFFNSLHLWSVELFMAFMVIHLWGKF